MFACATWDSTATRTPLSCRVRSDETRFGELLERVSTGEEVVITRHDKPVARLVPEGGPRVDEVQRSVEGLRAFQQRIRRRSRR